ncbi:MAG: hypothetical protein N4A76_17445 [Firmicutes bacterium]|jgi:23S rRNA pseudoU1915 N3-methylase RlmH|nr:hypothetical protein [Bacillota bacterium]
MGNDEYEKYGISKEYNRKIYENKSNMDDFRFSEERKIKVNERKRVRDDYTGKTIHTTQKAAKGVSEANWVEKAAETDHIVSLGELHQKHKVNPFLTDDDLKNIGNDETNYALTNKRINTQKKDKSFKEFLKVDPDVDIKAVKKLDKIAHRHIKKNVTSRTLKNVKDISLSGAKDGIKEGALSIGIGAANELNKYISGEKDFDEVLKSVGMQTLKHGASGSKTALAKVATKNSKVLGELSSKSNSLGSVIEVGMIIKNNMDLYLSDQMTQEELVKNILVDCAKSGVNLMAIQVIPLYGQLMTCVTVIKVGYSVVDSINNSYKSMSKQIGEINRESMELRKIEEEIEAQNMIIKQWYEDYMDEMDKNIDDGFYLIRDAINSNNPELFAGGLDKILILFDKEVKYKNYEEFDDFFMTEDTLNL